MPNTPLILDKLVSMTAIHDLELMEFSLLKTLEEFIRAQEILILKYDRNGDPCYQLTLKHQKYEIIWENIDLSEEVTAGVDFVRKTRKSFSRNIDSTKILTIWHILQAKPQEVFLVTTTKKNLNDLDSHMINGLLGIYRNFYEVLSDSQRDQLTGLSNRKTFDDLVNKIHIQRPLTTDSITNDRREEVTEDTHSFWLGMADLDNFKRVNDTWGHLYGDEVLLLTAQLMQEHFRENDYLFRFGGEEFVIIVRASSSENAGLAYERFRALIEKYNFPQVGQVTISIGVTKMDPMVFTATTLDRADTALYNAKKNGRNQVQFYEELLKKGLIEEKEIISGEIELF